MKYTMSRFFCTECGNETVPVWRKDNKQRESGHLKKLYCCHCKAEINCVEVKENDANYTLNDFKREFENGVFSLGERRK